MFFHCTSKDFTVFLERVNQLDHVLKDFIVLVVRITADQPNSNALMDFIAAVKIQNHMHVQMELIRTQLARYRE